MKQIWLFLIVGPLGLALGALAVHFARERWTGQLPFSLPAWSRSNGARKPASQPTAASTVGPMTLAAKDLRALLERCRPAKAGELLAPTDGEGTTGGMLQCAASWRGGDPSKVVRDLDREFEQMAGAQGYRYEIGSSFSAGVPDYLFLHTRRSLRNATSIVPVDIWVVRGADSALTLIVQVGAAVPPAGAEKRG